MTTGAARRTLRAAARDYAAARDALADATRRGASRWTPNRQRGSERRRAIFDAEDRCDKARDAELVADSHARWKARNQPGGARPLARRGGRPAPGPAGPPAEGPVSTARHVAGCTGSGQRVADLRQRPDHAGHGTEGRRTDPRATGIVETAAGPGAATPRPRPVAVEHHARPRQARRARLPGAGPRARPGRQAGATAVVNNTAGSRRSPAAARSGAPAGGGARPLPAKQARNRSWSRS